MSWHFYSAREVFDHHREKWDELNKRCDNHILLDSIFVSALIRYFGSDQTLLGIDNSNSNAAMLLVNKVRSGFWQTFQPSQGPLGLVLFGNGGDIKDRVAELIRSLPGYCLGLSILQQDTDFSEFVTVEHSRTAEFCAYADTSRVVVAGTFETFWKQTGRYFVDDLRRQTRRLEEQGVQMDFVTERDPDKVSECILDHASLEGSGWKGKEGTAITAEGPQGLFYRDILANFCSRGEGTIYHLLFNERVVASDLCLQRDGMTVVLKIAYDENLQGLSPGKFLHREILKVLFEERNTQALEWYGRVHDWQGKMGSTPRAMFHLNFYRDEWVPMVRDLVTRTRGLVLK